MKRGFSRSLSVVLRGFDKHGRKVILARTSVLDSKKWTLSDNFKFAFMVQEMWMEDLDQSSIAGFAVIQVGEIICKSSCNDNITNSNSSSSRNNNSSSSSSSSSISSD